MPDMTFDYLSWEAFATFVAVIAAFVVGLRQVGIATRQTAIQTEQITIQNRLADIEELKLRQALFDDRFEVYEATRAFLAHIVAHASVPGLAKTDNAELRESDRLLQQRFIEEIDRASFLFRPSVKKHLTQLWQTAVQINFHQKMQTDRNGREDYQKHVDGEFAQMKLLQQAHADLASIFGDELTLSAHGATFAPRPSAEDTSVAK